MFSTKTSVGIHILCVIARAEGTPVTSDWIAGSIGTNPALVRRLMSRLKQAGLINTSTHIGASGLTREASAITMLDVFTAVEQDQRVFDIHSGTNPQCPVGAHIEQTLSHIYSGIQTDLEKRMQHITLSHILNQLQKEQNI